MNPRILIAALLLVPVLGIGSVGALFLIVDQEASQPNTPTVTATATPMQAVTQSATQTHRPTTTPTPAATATATPTPTATPIPDTDGDGLNNTYEAELGLEKDDKDTDDDGIIDPKEVNGETDPRTADSDGDGIIDGDEVDRGTDPVNADTDGDGLADGYEIENDLDPLNPDTDEDGLDDKKEDGMETSATKADTDRDGLNDSREFEEETDPVDPDTDGDEYSDGEEVNEFPGSPLRMSIYIEVDVSEHTHLPRGDLREVKRTFSNAPVKSKNGANGIGLHFVVNQTDVDIKGDVTPSRVYEFYNEHKDLDDHYYMMIVEGIDGRTAGISIGYAMMLGDERSTPHTVMHELGHSLGLHDQFDGIDSWKYSVAEYPSVMNYNTDEDDRLDYSSTEPFDEWEWIEEHPLRPP